MELPEDPFGFDELEDVERSEPVHINGYTFTYMLADSGEPLSGVSFVGGEARHADSEEIVGRLTAVLVARNREVEEDDGTNEVTCFAEESEDEDAESQSNSLDFHDACSQAGHEVHECATALFSANGRLRRPLRDNVTLQSFSGGWLYVEEVHLLQAHRGMDIGLDFVVGLLDFLNGRWTLATLFPAGSPPQGRAADGVRKLAGHFARIGFKQVAAFYPLSHYWYLQSSAVLDRKSKAEAMDIDVIFPRPPVPMKDLDRELHEVCRGITADGESNGRIVPKLEQLRCLVENGADPDRAGALHICAANVDVEAARELLELGAGVNSQDRHNCSTPLHVAAGLCEKSGMLGILSLLLSFGACLSAINQEGMTPLECARHARKQAMDFRKMRGVSKKGQGHLCQYDQCIMLLSSFVQQPERKMIPRLK